MESLIVALNAVVPFIVYLLLGMISKRLKAVREPFLKELNGAAFKVFFPFIMFNNLYDVDFSALKGAGYVIFAIVSTLTVIILAFIAVPFFVKENPRRGVVIQAIYRSNSVLYAIPLATSVLGQEGAAMASIVVAFLVPMYNIVSVLILEYYSQGSVTAGKLILNILKNPLIIGAITGAIFNLSPLTMPECLAGPISVLCSMATPLALFVLGGTLRFSDIRKNRVPLTVGIALKLIVIPCIIVFIMSMMHMGPSELFVVFCMFATPVAAASYPMAQSMGADADLAGEYVMISTLLSILTIFVWILILRNIGSI